MAETFRPAQPEQQWSGGNGYQSTNAENASVSYENSANGDGGDVGKTLLIGVLGGILSAAGYMVYKRLPEDQKERLQAQAKTMLQTRINEIRQNFNI